MPYTVSIYLYIYISLTLLLLAAFSVDALSMTRIGCLSHLAHQSRRRCEVTGVESAWPQRSESLELSWVCPLEVLLVVSVDPQKKVVRLCDEPHKLRLGGSKFERYDLYDLGTISSGTWDAVTAEAPNH